jgi:hypothetical protein|tara:strand:+ start:285 stop:656 length:372 start_codon:yes stop_codon:yes gene_type:complete
MTTEERAMAINAEVWSLRRPDSVKSPQDVTRYYYPTITHPTTGQWAIVGETDEQVRIHQDVDMTVMISLMPEVPQDEKDQLVAYIDANRGGTVAFSTFIPSSSTQLTHAEAEAAGWFPDDTLN